MLKESETPVRWEFCMPTGKNDTVISLCRFTKTLYTSCRTWGNDSCSAHNSCHSGNELSFLQNCELIENDVSLIWLCWHPCQCYMTCQSNNWPNQIWRTRRQIRRARRQHKSKWQIISKYVYQQLSTVWIKLWHYLSQNSLTTDPKDCTLYWGQEVYGSRLKWVVRITNLYESKM